ncbi:MAG: hypothetical protein IKO01_12035 [Kiritimatiellae bacterium]|nr:hypothetical protein [Kiritimatiellia bacterium]
MKTNLRHLFSFHSSLFSAAAPSAAHRHLFSFHSSLFSAAASAAAHRPLFTFLFSLFTLAASAALAATPLLCNPYTFVGRITDARAAAFDNQRPAILSAYSTADAAGAPPTLLARSTTFYRDDTPHNYRLTIPMSSTPADGCALQNDLLEITATDDAGRLWTGVIDPATVGTPGTLCEVDIVLSEDADGDGIDDALLQDLINEWAASDYYTPDTPFDIHADPDGDDLSTLDEAHLGTDPFNPSDTLQIDSLDLTTTPPSLTASLPAGHVYTLETTPSLTSPWTPTDFTSTPSSSPRRTLSTPSTPARTPVTLYLLPTTNPSPAFLRLSTR